MQRRKRVGWLAIESLCFMLGFLISMRRDCEVSESVTAGRMSSHETTNLFVVMTVEKIISLDSYMRPHSSLQQLVAPSSSKFTLTRLWLVLDH